MAPNALHLPHVVQLIADSLSFQDLTNCVLASRTWHRAFTRFLYKDVITFRSKSVEGDMKQPSRSYFSNTASRLGLIKHGHHICALTCRYGQLLAILDTATCVNLIEVNVVMDPLPPNDMASLAKLTELMVQNTNLQAVSIENINFFSVNLLQKLSEFVDGLDRFPRITCVYLDGYLQSTHNRTEILRGMDTITTKLLGRVKQENRQIKSLSLQRPDLLARSKRGPSLGKAWIAREFPILGAESRDLARASGGRWESELRLRRSDGPRPTIAVVETESELRLVVPEEIYRTLAADFLQRYPNCTAVALPGPKRDQIQQFVSQCSRLTSVDVQQIYDPLDLSSILIPGNSLSSLCVESPHSSSAIFSQPIQPTTTGTLVSLVLDTSGISMNNLFSILASATMLQEMQVQVVYIDGTEPSESPLWASADLHKVVVGLYLTGHRPDRHQDMNDDRTHWTDEPAGSAERSTAAAARFGSSFLEQLNAQHELKELDLSFNHRLFPKFSPLLDLSLDPVKGLPRLCNLGRLEKFVIHGLAHHLGRAEVEWMREYWPLLFSIEVPLIHCWFGEDDAITSCRNMYHGGIP
ncbi:hypothetical protein CPB97_000762, partial [Podila verticillata]